MWERLSRFSFDRFEIRRSEFGFFVLKFMWERLCRFALTYCDSDSSFESPFPFLLRVSLVLKLVWERLCCVALVDLFWFEYRNPFLGSFSIPFFSFFFSR